MPFLRFDHPDPETNDALRTAFYEAMLERGVFLHPRHMWFISLAHQAADIDTTLEHARSAMKLAREQCRVTLNGPLVDVPAADIQRIVDRYLRSEASASMVVMELVQLTEDPAAIGPRPAHAGRETRQGFASSRGTSPRTRPAAAPSSG